MLQSYQDTALWKELARRRSKPEGADIARSLESMLIEIERVLAEAVQKGMTLHDLGHALRVAERMHEVIPAAVLGELGGYELALLVLSAYLHDIGMVAWPPLRQEQEDYLSGKPSALGPEQEKVFQNGWTRGNRRLFCLSRTRTSAGPCSTGTRATCMRSGARNGSGIPGTRPSGSISERTRIGGKT